MPISGWPEKPVLAAARPKCNSVLHLYGKWLFEAAFIGTDFSANAAATSGSNNNSNAPPVANQGPNAQDMQQKQQQQGKRPTSLNVDPNYQQQQQLRLDFMIWIRSQQNIN